MKYLFIIFLFGCSAVMTSKNPYSIHEDESDASMIILLDSEVIYNESIVQDKISNRNNSIGMDNDKDLFGSDNRESLSIDVKSIPIRISESGVEDSSYNIEDSSIDSEENYLQPDTSIDVNKEGTIDGSTTGILSDSTYDEVVDDAGVDTNNIELDECNAPGGKVYDCSITKCDPKSNWIATSIKPWCFQLSDPFVIDGSEYSILLGGNVDSIFTNPACVYGGEHILSQWRGITPNNICTKITVQGNRGIRINELECANSETFTKCSVITVNERFEILVGMELEPGWLHIESTKLENGQKCPFSCE